MKHKHNYSLAWVTIAAIIGLVLVATLCSCMKTEPEDENGILDQVVVYCAGHPRYVARGLKAKEVTVQYFGDGGLIHVHVPAVDSKGKIIGKQCFEGTNISVMKQWK